MKKSVLYTTLILSFITVSSLAINGMVIHADSINKKANSYSVSHNIKEGHNRKIEGRFDVLFTRPNDFKHDIRAGYIEDTIPNGIKLSVIRGGSEALVWTAAVVDDRTGERISEFVKFTHGDNQLLIPIDKSKVRLNDSISLVMNNDNFPNPDDLHVYGTISSY